AGDRADEHAGGDREEHADPREGWRRVALEHEKDERELPHRGAGAHEERGEREAREPGDPHQGAVARDRLGGRLHYARASVRSSAARSAGTSASTSMPRSEYRSCLSDPRSRIRWSIAPPRSYGRVSRTFVHDARAASASRSRSTGMPS